MPKNFHDMQKKAWEANRNRKPWNFGKKASLETIEKLRISHLGKSNANKGRTGWFHHSDEWKRKARERNLKSGIRPPHRMGSNHPSWKGGISTMPWYRAFVQNKRDTRKQANGGDHSFEQWEALKIKYQHMCLCCKRSEPEITLSQDHIIPVSRGGSDNIENIQPLCRSCNSRKNDKHVDYRSPFIYA